MKKEDLKELADIAAKELSQKIAETLKEFSESNALMKTVERFGTFFMPETQQTTFPFVVCDRAYELARASFFEYELEEEE